MKKFLLLFGMCLIMLDTYAGPTVISPPVDNDDGIVILQADCDAPVDVIFVTYDLCSFATPVSAAVMDTQAPEAMPLPVATAIHKHTASGQFYCNSPPHY